LRGECRAISGVTVVTMLVCFILFCTRGRGRGGRPAFPAPSELQKAGRLLAKLAWMRGEIAESYHDVIARSEATKQSILSVASKLDCFAPLAMTVSNVV